MGSTTIALSTKVYKMVLGDKHMMENIVGHQISFSVVASVLHSKCDKKLTKEDIENAVEKKKTV